MENLYRKDDKLMERFNERKFEDEPMIMESEVCAAIKDIANNKAPGIDNLNIELWKAAGEEMVWVITAICQQIW